MGGIEMADLQTGAIVVTVPVLAMMIGSVVAVVYRPSELLRCICSSIAAGVLVAAVALELLPVLVESGSSWYAGPSGFAIGIIFFTLLAYVLPDPDDEDDDDGEEVNADIDETDETAVNEKTALLTVPKTTTTRHTSETTLIASPTPAPATTASHTLSVCKGASCASRGAEGVIADIEDLLNGSTSVSIVTPHTCMNETQCSLGPHMTLESSTPHSVHRSLETFSAADAEFARKVLRERLGLKHAHARPPSRGVDVTSMEKKAAAAEGTGKSGLPWTRLIVVTIDGAMDGLALGLTNAIGLKEAALIAGATTIEMCFVGVSLSCALQAFKIPFWVKLAIVLSVPLGMYVGFLVGAFALHGVDQDSDIFVSVIGFAAAALLYLALVELIPESFSIAEELGTISTDTWLSASMFLGFTIVLTISQFDDEFEGGV